MIERNIKETIREYDENGNVVRETVTETVEKDNNPSPVYYYNTPVFPSTWGDTGAPVVPTCATECNCKEGAN